MADKHKQNSRLAFCANPFLLDETNAVADRDPVRFGMQNPFLLDSAAGDEAEDDKKEFEDGGGDEEDSGSDEEDSDDVDKEDSDADGDMVYDDSDEEDEESDSDMELDAETLARFGLGGKQPQAHGVGGAADGIWRPPPVPAPGGASSSSTSTTSHANVAAASHKASNKSSKSDDHVWEVAGRGAGTAGLIPGASASGSAGAGQAHAPWEQEMPAPGPGPAPLAPHHCPPNLYATAALLPHMRPPVPGHLAFPVQHPGGPRPPFAAPHQAGFPLHQNLLGQPLLPSMMPPFPHARPPAPPHMIHPEGAAPAGVHPHPLHQPPLLMRPPQAGTVPALPAPPKPASPGPAGAGGPHHVAGPRPPLPAYMQQFGSFFSEDGQTALAKPLAVVIRRFIEGRKRIGRLAGHRPDTNIDARAGQLPQWLAVQPEYQEFFAIKLVEKNIKRAASKWKKNWDKPTTLVDFKMLGLGNSGKEFCKKHSITLDSGCTHQGKNKRKNKAMKKKAAKVMKSGAKMKKMKKKAAA